MTTDQTQQAPCPNCTKAGLPILPLRYAVARSDGAVENKAPELASPFGEGVENIAIPDSLARYTLRTLRGGYLYVFNEVRGEWKAYEVDEHGTLFEFDVRDNSPPPVDEDEIREVCSRHGSPDMSQCVIIPDAHRAGAVWLGFSDVAWTPAVWERHKRQAYRERHMRRIDVGAWVASQGNGGQPHMDVLSNLPSRVSEYAIPHLDTSGGVGESEGARAAREARNAERSARAEQARRDGREPAEEDLVYELEPITVTAVDYPAFGFSLAPFNNKSDFEDEFVEEAIRAGERGKAVSGSPGPFVPAMVALPDPVGIAGDLNELVKLRAAEWADVPARRERYESALLIGAIREAVEKGGEIQVSERRQNTIGLLGALFPAHVGGAYGSPGRTGVVRAIDAAGQLSENELESIHANAWGRYESMYDEAARVRYLQEEYPAAQARFEAEVIEPLDKAYLGWLESDAFKHYFICNFDPHDPDSGVAFTAVLYMVIKDASGRSPVCDYMEACLDENPSQAEAVLCRGLICNQDALAQQWMQIAERGPEPQGGWNAVANTLWGGINDVLGDRVSGSITNAMNSLTQYTREYSGVMMRKLQNLYDLSSGRLIASQVETRTVLMLGAIARHASPTSVLVQVRSRVSRLQAVRIVGTANDALLTGGRTAAHQHPDSMRRLFDPTGPRVHFQGLLLVEQTRTTRVSGTLDLTPEGLEARVNASIRRLSRLEAGGHLVGALLAAATLGSAWKEMRRAPGLKTTLGFGTGIAALTGGLMESAGAALRNTAWGSARLAPRLGRFRAVQASMTRAKALSFAGKLIGTVGAVVSGVLAFWDGVTEFGVNPAYGGIMMVLGIGMAAVGVLLFFSVITGGAAFIAALILSIIMFAVGFMKKNEIEKWLDRTIGFGNHRNGVFASIKIQEDAINALGHAESGAR